MASERNRILRQIASQKKAAFMRSLAGTEVEAITLHSRGGNFTDALTNNYLKMRIAGCHEANRWVRATVEHVEGEFLLGQEPGVAVT